MIHSIEGAEVMAKAQRRLLVQQIGLAVEEELARTLTLSADAEADLLQRIHRRWTRILT